MQQIDFYILEDADERKALLFVCALVEKLYHLEKPTFIRTVHREQTEKIDQLLWTFKDISFVPHQQAETQTALTAPVVIGEGETLPSPKEYLINLDLKIPHYTAAINYLIEIIFADETVREHGRARFKYYREQNFQLKVHKIRTHEYEQTINEFNR